MSRSDPRSCDPRSIEAQAITESRGSTACARRSHRPSASNRRHVHVKERLRVSPKFVSTRVETRALSAAGSTWRSAGLGPAGQSRGTGAARRQRPHSTVRERGRWESRLENLLRADCATRPFAAELPFLHRVRSSHHFGFVTVASVAPQNCEGRLLAVSCVNSHHNSAGLQLTVVVFGLFFGNAPAN